MVSKNAALGAQRDPGQLYAEVRKQPVEPFFRPAVPQERDFLFAYLDRVGLSEAPEDLLPGGIGRAPERLAPVRVESDELSGSLRV